MILWTVDDEIPKFLAIVCWETFLNCWAIWSRSSQSGEPLPILACEWLSLSGILFLYPIMTLTCFLKLFTCGMLKTGVFWAFLNFPSLLLPLSQLFWNVLQAWNSKWVTICVFNFNWIQRFANLCIQFLFTFVYTTSQLHWIWGCMNNSSRDAVMMYQNMKFPFIFLVTHIYIIQ